MNIGILSLLYKNYNYGGVLQAYALNESLQKRMAEGDSVKQIRFDLERLAVHKRLIRFIKVPIREKVYCIYEKIVYFSETIKTRNPAYQNNFASEIASKIKAFEDFTDKYIRSTERIYCEADIDKTLFEFDCFVVGSDQVWNPDIIHSNVYFLGFADNKKYKSSYAASVSKCELTIRQKNIFKKNLDSFNRISVRESNTEIISSLTKNKVEWVLDPTLLLTLEEWEGVCSDRFDNEESYLFCYFLNSDKNQQEIAKAYAKSEGLKIICTTDLKGVYKDEGKSFCDLNVYDASPADFLSLIKNAKFVMTDSFHATIFSLIFQKQFLVFERDDFPGMKTRMETLLQLFEAQSRLVNWEKNSCYNIEQIEGFDYSQTFEKFIEMKLFSEKYLDEIIKEAKELVNGK